MPAHPVIPRSRIFDVLQNIQIFDANGKLKKESDQVWIEAHLHLRKMKTHNLYMNVFYDRKSIQTDLNAVMKIEEKVVSSPNIAKTNSQNEDVSFDMINDLHSLKFSITFENVIKVIGSQPFHVIYSLPDQQNLWKDFIKYAKLSVSFIAIDNLVQSDMIGYSMIKSIFFYAFLVEVRGEIISFFQAISDEMNKPFFNFFFRHCLRDGFLAPLQINCGYSHIILNSLSHVFNGLSLHLYNLKCYDYLMMNSPLPSVLIHVDTIELLKVVDKWPCLNNRWKKKFYICSIIYLSTIDSLDTFEETVVDIFLLCKSELSDAIVEESRLNILGNIESDVIISKYNEYLKCKETLSGTLCSLLLDKRNPSEHKSVMKSTIYSYINNLLSKAIKKCKMITKNSNYLNNVNAYYCEDFIEFFIDLLLDFTIWTRLIINESDEISSPVHKVALQYLNHLKEHDVIKDKNVPNFLKCHYEFLEKPCVKGRDIINDIRKSKPLLKDVEKSNYSYLLHEENWKGKNCMFNDNNVNFDEAENCSQNVPTNITETKE